MPRSTQQIGSIRAAVGQGKGISNTSARILLEELDAAIGTVDSPETISVEHWQTLYVPETCEAVVIERGRRRAVAVDLRNPRPRLVGGLIFEREIHEGPIGGKP